MTTNLILTSYNILHPAYALALREAAGVTTNDAGEIVSNWPQRQHLVAANLTASGCDIACLQEVSLETLAPLAAQFRELAFYPIPSLKPQSSNAVGNAILARGKNLVLESSQKLPGATPTARTATAAFFTLLPSAQRLLVMSVHIAGYPPAEKNAAKLAALKQPGLDDLQCHLNFAEAQKRTVDAILIAGDFNEDPNKDGDAPSRHALMRAHGYLGDHTPTPSEPAHARKLDWIYMWSKHPAQLTPIPTPPPHPGASDHLPVTVRVGLG